MTAIYTPKVLLQLIFESPKCPHALSENNFKQEVHLKFSVNRVNIVVCSHIRSRYDHFLIFVRCYATESILAVLPYINTNKTIYKSYKLMN